ncbi:hypothetical protein [Streptomyces sp. NBC_00338]|uniref:hypothetical protein n=1 Tax=Streptomyces sp. NBC_00338 TaxID=2975715 RepID=UPI0022550F56|nr:hypothetical protein [Streptomyces sp. NBC_00338]MCX5138362.1 hypothetical protein [Streptomyces sp. NBC_00338]MCX5145151.1 hypothetical protein [Streptomyces sp. NBC_00338]
MTRRLTVAERLASADKNILLKDFASQNSWDHLLVEQAVFHFGQLHEEWSCNDLRTVLPELGQGFLGVAIKSLQSGGIIAHTNQTVPSTQANTHAHRIAVWTLTARGRRIAAERTARAQGRAA